MSGEHEAASPVECGPGHEVVSDTLDQEPRCLGAQQSFEVVGDGLLAVALGRDVDQFGGERQEVPQSEAP
jgi:hypothetical protein